jgi:hypothetical protein
MLGSDILIATAVTYTLGAILSVSYHLFRVSELKVAHDSTRVKDAKNDCVALTRHHAREIKRFWAWPASLLDPKVLAWIRELDKR